MCVCDCVLQTFVYKNNLYFQPNPFTTPVQVTDNKGNKYVYNGICDWLYEGCYCSVLISRDLRSFVIRLDFESYVRFEIRFVLMVLFEIFESSALSIVIRKETIGGG